MNEDIRGSVVVGFDGSIPARLALYWGVREAASRNVPLRLVHVFRWPLPELVDLGHQMKTLDRDQLHQAAVTAVTAAVEHSRAVAPGIEISSEVVPGDPVRVLAERSATASLLVLGTSGQTSVDGVLIGSSSAELARCARCPVVIVRSDGKLPLQERGQRVVVGVDNSPGSTRAVWFAFEFAARHDAQLVAVHAWCDLPMEGLTAGLGEGIDKALAREEARAVLTGVLTEPAERYPGVRLREVVRVDRPAKALLEEGRGAALLVVGSHGRAQAAHVPLGSVSHVLLHYAETSVAIIPSRADRLG